MDRNSAKALERFLDGRPCRRCEWWHAVFDGDDGIWDGAPVVRRFLSAKPGRRPGAIWVSSRSGLEVIIRREVGGRVPVACSSNPPATLRDARKLAREQEFLKRAKADLRGRGWVPFDPKVLARSCGSRTWSRPKGKGNEPLRYAKARPYLSRMHELLLAVPFRLEPGTRATGRAGRGNQFWISPAGQLVIRMALDLSKGQGIAAADALDMLTSAGEPNREGVPVA